MQFGAKHRVAQGTMGPCLKSSLSTPSSLKAQQKRKSRCLVEREPVLLRPTGELACVLCTRAGKQPLGVLLSVLLFYIKKTTNMGLSLLCVRCAIPPRSRTATKLTHTPHTAAGKLDRPSLLRGTTGAARRIYPSHPSHVFLAGGR